MLRTLIFGTGTIGVFIGLGVFLVPHLIAGGSTPADYVQGGVAAAAITFAGGAIRYMGGMVDKERARGDRLEVALLDKVLPALTSSALAVQQASDAMKELLARSRAS